MDRLHLVADDLTGALDSAAQLTRSAGAIDVGWGAPPVGVRRLAVDAGTRELGPDEAEASLATLFRALPPDAAALRFAKIDSLLRGHPAAAIAIWLRFGGFDHCVIAPAFPHQARVTRGGRQLQRSGTGWEPTGADLRADLERRGLAVALRRPGDAGAPGITLWDAESDRDLQEIVAAGRALPGSVLWSGSGGLAGALAAAGSEAHHDLPLARPVLGVFGTDHPVTAAQLLSCGAAVLDLPDGGADSVAAVSLRLRQAGVALVRLALPRGTTRPEAARRIASETSALIRALPRPATLLVAGGETLRGICEGVAADHLEVDGQLEQGIPRSILRGGPLDGVRVVSKSGAFGDVDVLRRLLKLDPIAPRGEHP